MADALIFEFEGVGREQYEAVNRNLGLDPVNGSGDWPKGMTSHVGAAKPGGWVVFEVWDSKDDQEAWMQGRRAGARGGGRDRPLTGRVARGHRLHHPRRLKWPPSRKPS